MIPAALEDIFGPDEEQRRRFSFRFHLQHDMGYYLEAQTAPWIMFVFDQDGHAAETGNVAMAAAFVKLDHQQRFEDALKAIGAFAMEVKSPFLANFQWA